MKNKVIVFDLDGTLLGANNEIIGGTETLNCLDSLQQMGWTLAICTGRLDHDILKIEEQYKLKIEHRISQNGAVCMKGQQLIATLIDKQEAINIYKEIQKEDIRIELNTVSNRYWKSEVITAFVFRYDIIIYVSIE